MILAQKKRILPRVGTTIQDNCTLQSLKVQSDMFFETASKNWPKNQFFRPNHFLNAKIDGVNKNLNFPTAFDNCTQASYKGVARMYFLKRIAEIPVHEDYASKCYPHLV